METMFMGIAFWGILLVPLVVIGAVGEAIDIALGYLDPWDFR